MLPQINFRSAEQKNVYFGRININKTKHYCSMKKFKLFFAVFAILAIFGFKSSYAQSSPVLYFCESYSSAGEIGISDRFTTGYLTVMVKSDSPLGLRDVSIQFDKYNPSTGKFSYYNKYAYAIEPDMKYVYFSRNEESDMSFKEPGIYRVFLLDGSGSTVASSLIEITR